MDSTNSSTVTSLKTQAKLLRQALADEGIELGHVKCLHAVARSHGYKNWNTAREAGGVDFQAAFDILLSLGAPSDREEKPKVPVAWEPLHTEDWYGQPGAVVEDLATHERKAQEFRQHIYELGEHGGFTVEEASKVYSDDWWSENEDENEEWKSWQQLNPAWVRQVLESMVADHCLRQEEGCYETEEYELMSMQFPFEEDMPGGMLDLLAGGSPPGDVFRGWAAGYVATASRYYRLAKLFDADPRLSVHDPVNQPPETEFLEIWAPESMMGKIAESVGGGVRDGGNYLR